MNLDNCKNSILRHAMPIIHGINVINDGLGMPYILLNSDIKKCFYVIFERLTWVWVIVIKSAYYRVASVSCKSPIENFSHNLEFWWCILKAWTEKSSFFCLLKTAIFQTFFINFGQKTDNTKIWFFKISSHNQNNQLFKISYRIRIFLFNLPNLQK